MARPAKSVNTKTGAITKEEEMMRQITETRLKGDDDKIREAPSHLTEDQKGIYYYIVAELEAAGILGNLDVYVLTTASICIDRLQKMECQINEDMSLLENSTFMSTKDKYTKDFFRCCNELSLSPQARAKMSISNVEAMKKKKNPLVEALDL